MYRQGDESAAAHVPSRARDDWQSKHAAGMQSRQRPDCTPRRPHL